MQPFRSVRGRHCQVEPYHRMHPGLANEILDGGTPEQFGPLPGIGIKGSPVEISRPRQVALEEGLQGGDQQGLAETARSGKEGVLRLQLGTMAVGRSQQLAQVAGLVDIQATGPANRDERRLIRM